MLSFTDGVCGKELLRNGAIVFCVDSRGLTLIVMS